MRALRKRTHASALPAPFNIHAPWSPESSSPVASHNVVVDSRDRPTLRITSMRVQMIANVKCVD